MRGLLPDHSHHRGRQHQRPAGPGNPARGGTLSVQGGFQWFGIAIIQGSLKTSGGGGQPAHFWGATLAHDSVSLGQENTISGAANILYSKCSVIKALEMTGLVSPLRTRSWIQLF